MGINLITDNKVVIRCQNIVHSLSRCRKCNREKYKLKIYFFELEFEVGVRIVSKRFEKKNLVFSDYLIFTVSHSPNNIVHRE